MEQQGPEPGTGPPSAGPVCASPVTHSDAFFFVILPYFSLLFSFFLFRVNPKKLGTTKKKMEKENNMAGTRT